jgi:hypothetical protein
MTQREDLVTVSLQGDDGKPRPALIVQTELLCELSRQGILKPGRQACGRRSKRR